MPNRKASLPIVMLSVIVLMIMNGMPHHHHDAEGLAACFMTTCCDDAHHDEEDHSDHSHDMCIANHLYLISAEHDLKCKIAACRHDTQTRPVYHLSPLLGLAVVAPSCEAGYICHQAHYRRRSISFHDASDASRDNGLRAPPYC